MKIQCDVCNSGEASVYCTADEAALCAACDHHVHHANKLASKHHRFSLLLPAAKDVPICDICQERRAFLFCQQDRAILCRECDGPIHAANEHTLKHNRFLLTGVKLSAASTLYSAAKGSDSGAKKPNSAVSIPAKSVTSATNKAGNGGNPAMETSSLSEYLIETLPGWRVEDLLDPSSFHFGLSKTNLDDGLLPFDDAELDRSFPGSFSSERSGLWVPQSPAPLYHHGSVFAGMKETAKEKEAMRGTERRRYSDDGFTVPQISPPSSTGSNKRSRAFW